MFNFVITRTVIVTSLMVTIYALETLYKSTVPNAYMARVKLDIVVQSEALPVVLIMEENRELSIPEDIIEAKAENKKIVSAQFSMMSGLQTQIFFCPQQDSENKTCLAPKDFENLQQLKCGAMEGIRYVYVRKLHHPCGIEGSGVLHRVFFPICPPDEGYQYQYKTRGLTIYDFCYNEHTSKVLFTSRYILSPKLLATFLLYRDRELNYFNAYDESYPIANYLEIRSALNWEPITPNYKVQKLVPKEDMAFGIWKITTEQYFNFEMQHVALFEIWNDINTWVREEAIRQDELNVQFLVKTGIFDHRVYGIPPQDIYQKYNRWVEMIIGISTVTNRIVSGIVVFMNNFLNIGYESTPELHSLYYGELEVYCEQIDICATSLKNRVENARGWIRCCLVTPRIAQLFGEQISDNLPQMSIRYLTL